MPQAQSPQATGRQAALEPSRSRVTARVPHDSHRTVPGHYFLFALVDDVPSNGVIVSIERRPG